jgi:hypothetical protein
MPEMLVDRPSFAATGEQQGLELACVTSVSFAYVAFRFIETKQQTQLPIPA